MTAVQIIAHRGASAIEKENTLAAFAAAARMGADAVELDVRRTADGLMAVHHDPVLPDGRVICETNGADLPSHVPFLDQALDACAGMWVNIEIKNYPDDPDYDPSDAITAIVARYLEQRDEDDRWLISGFSRHTVDAMRTLRPTIKTAWLTVGVGDEDIEKVARDLARSGHTALHPWVERLTQKCIDVCHSHALQVNSWTCDDPKKMQEIIDWGIDGICTNVPDIALGVRANQA